MSPPFFRLVLGGALLTTLAGAEPVALEEVLQSVVNRYPVLESAKKDSEAARGEVRAAEGGLDISWKTKTNHNRFGFYENDRFDSLIEQPTTLWGATFFGGYRLGLGKYQVYYGQYETNPGGEALAGINVPLWRDGPTDRRRTNIRKAKLGADAAELQVEQQLIESVRGATHRYWDWVLAGRRAAVFRQLLKIAEDRDGQLAERVKHGDAPVFERRDNERAILQRKALLVGAERSAQQAALELSLFLRTNEGDPIVLGDDRLPPEILKPVPGEVPLADPAQALSRRPDLTRFQATKAQNEAELRLADNQSAPKVDVMMAAVDSLRDVGSFRDGTRLEAGLTIEIPLQANVAGGREDSARATAQRLELQERFLRDRIITDVRDAKSALDAALARFETVRQEVELTKRLEKGERERFFHGDSNLIFVNLREQATADAAVRELEALADYRKSLATLRAALGLSQ